MLTTTFQKIKLVIHVAKMQQIMFFVHRLMMNGNDPIGNVSRLASALDFNLLYTIFNALSSVSLQPHISNQNIESSSLSLCKLVIYLNCFLRYLVQSYISRGARPKVTSLNRQHTKYEVNNTKGKKYFT